MKCEIAVSQSKTELQEFIAVLQKVNVKSYLEIGCKFGGSLWHIGKSLPQGARIVGVDLPGVEHGAKDAQPHLEECVLAVKAKGYDAQLIIGNSHDGDVIEKVYSLGPFDACFIDGGHTEADITQDFNNYSVCTTKLVGIHDISYLRFPEDKKRSNIEVPRVWQQIKKGFRHFEIRHEKKDCGIGVVWV